MHDASPELTIWHVVAPFDEELGVGHDRQAGEPASFAYVFSSQSSQYESRLPLVFPAGLVRDWEVVRWYDEVLCTGYHWPAMHVARSVISGRTDGTVGQCHARP